MHLKTLEKEISKVILQRGKDYFSDGAETDLQVMNNGQCFAIVEGNDDYEVDIRLGRNSEISEFSSYPRRPAMVDELSKVFNHKALN